MRLSRFSVSSFAILALSVPVVANTTADSVTEFDTGTISSNPFLAGYQASGAAAVGMPASTDGFGTDVTPFTPPFQSSDLTMVSAGGHITLHLAAPITNATGPEIGVFTNTGLVASFDPDTSAVSAAPATFSPISQAIVSVSATGDPGSFVTLNGGAPMDFGNPTNAFTNTLLTPHPADGFIDMNGGTIPTDFFKPFNGTLDQFYGESYPQMLSLLDGSAGGTWIDIASAGLAQVNYVRFDVPADATYSFIVDGVTAVPEPSSLGLLIVGLVALARRKQR